MILEIVVLFIYISSLSKYGIPNVCQECENFFENITFAHEMNLEKKDAAIWRAVAEKNGVRPEDCMVFDDSLSACRGAKTAGMQTVGVYDNFFAADEDAMRGLCHWYIRSFEELLEK